MKNIDRKTIKTINIKTDSDNPIVFDLVAEEIINISNAIKKFRTSKLSERAIILIIADASSMSQKAVRTILYSIETLPIKYLKKP